MKKKKKKLNTEFFLNQQFHYWVHITKRFKNIHPHINLYTNVHSNIIPDSQKVETAQMLIN